MTEMDGIARQDIEQLSAFLDGELSPAEAERLEARLATDQLLTVTLEALRATSEVVGSLPQVDPPRSFALTPEMVRAPRAYPILQLSTAMAALGFVLVVGADLLLSNAASSSLQAPEQAFFAADQLTEQHPGESAPAAAEAPADAEAFADAEAPAGAELFADAEAPATEDAIAEEAEPEIAAAAEPEAESGQGASDGDTEGFFRSEEAADEFAGASATKQDAASGEDSAEQEALEIAADEELLAGRLAASELDAAAEDRSGPLNLLRVIEIGLAAALVVLIGLTLWIRPRA